MRLADRCSAEFDGGFKTRGEQYFRKGRVHLDYVVGNTVRAKVSDDSGDCEVLLDWNDADMGILGSSCACPHFEEEELCEHVWAAVLAADAQGVGPRKGTCSLTVLEADSDDKDLDDDDLDDEDSDDQWDDDPEDSWEDDAEGSYDGGYSPSGRRMPGSFPWQQSGPPRPGRALNWQRQLSAVFENADAARPRETAFPQFGKDREAWYVIDVCAQQQTDGLIIQLFQRETKRNGEFGKLKVLSIDRRGIDRFPRPEDREMLRLLLANNEAREETNASYGNRYAYRYYGYEPKTSEVLLAAGAYDLLPKLCATGRLVWMLNSSQQTLEEAGCPLAWDDGPPWRFHLDVTPDDQRQHWLLEGRLVRDGAMLPLKTPALVSDGLVLLHDSLARLETGDLAAWITACRRHPVITVPYKDRWELLQRLWQLPSRPEISLPANLACEEVRMPPQGRIVIHSPKGSYDANRFHADVEFQYDGKKVPAAARAAGLVDADNQRILVRDRDKERDLLSSLLAGEARAADRSNSGRHDLWIPRLRFSALVDELVRAGWIVEAEGARVRKAGDWRLSVTTAVDWFDLEGTCDFEGMTAQLPALLAALRHGEKYVRLGDGSRGLLPQEWLDKFAALANLGEADGDHVRFRPSQAMLLDALLAAQKEVSVDQQFDHIRRKLRSFAGVSRRDEPRGFVGQLRDYQKDGLGWLHFLRDFRLGGCLADDMGLGKTIQVLALLQSRRARPKEDGGRAPSLAVVPRSLVFNWIEEARRFTPHLRVLDYTGPLRKDALKHLNQYDLVVTTYGTLHRDIAKLKNTRFDYAILDEAQAIKNAQAQRAKACRLLQAEHRLAMTGTPVENHLGELWSIFEFLNPGMLGSSSAFQGISKAAAGDHENLDMLRRALAPFILRRTKGQVLTELPEKTEQTLYCDLEGKQQRRYQELRDYYRAALSQRIEQSGMAKAKIHVLEALLRLRQAACHPGLVDKDQVDQPSAKLEALMEQLKEVIEEGHKVLVFSQFTSLLAIVRRRLDAEGTVYEYLDGRTHQRQQRVERFQNDPDCPLFLISLKAGGHGLNLTAADYVFILDPWWNPAVEAQAVDRTHRIGQSRHVFAYRLIARDTVEEKILELQKTKRDLADAIVSADSNVLRNLTAEDLQMLLS